MEFNILDWRKNEIVFVVVVLTAILGVSVFQLKIGEMKTRDAQRKADAELVGRALERYFEDHGRYPTEKDGKIVSCGDKGFDVCEWDGMNLVDEDNVVYLKRIPLDPLTDKGRTYVYEMDGEKYRVLVGLENKRDSGIRGGLTKWCGDGVECNWYAGN